MKPEKWLDEKRMFLWDLLHTLDRNLSISYRSIIDNYSYFLQFVELGILK